MPSGTNINTVLESDTDETLLMNKINANISAFIASALSAGDKLIDVRISLGLRSGNTTFAYITYYFVSP